ncbi:hypothetical protein CKM354_001008900 [Cercospora kikuchii]|uniref:F-box domain-containing protein n=1 Tax=Cercospora kikuchii TaxID=84275 RepID=A0A9P3CSX3_9PEZI|nr:uncharacterized protein CKM354_001008900 [Cercospora kikuchii]GIZ46987.1 hypothetical protein CKM354_001008900 [Cercospora kikuchii]
MPPLIEEPPPRRLDNLAIELQLQILSNLPPRQLLLTCRLISRHFRDVIDLEENHGSLVGGSISASLDRLNAFIKRHCEFPLESEDGGPDAFLDAIFDFIRVRKLGPRWENELDLFTQFWLHRLDGQQRRQYIIDAYTNEFVTMCEHSVDESALEPSGWFYDKFEEKVCIMYLRTKILMQSYERPLVEHAPRCEIMERRCPILGAEQPVRTRVDEMRDLHRCLGVPGFDAISPYTYCVSAIWPLAKLMPDKRELRALKGIERAVVLEEVYIY